jgi:hypothetical protein
MDGGEGFCGEPAKLKKQLLRGASPPRVDDPAAA